MFSRGPLRPAEAPPNRAGFRLKGSPRTSDPDVARLQRAEGIPIERLTRFHVPNPVSALCLIALLVAGMSGCAGTAWDKALATDTPQAYHHFMRKYPDSDHARDAEERIAFHKVKRRPSPQRFEAFRQTYPDSPLIAELRPLVESQFFDGARAAGTPEAYRAFATEFPDGPFAERALGNAVFLDADGFAGQPAALRRFAVEHPASDFAAEALRSVAALDTRAQTRFDRVGLVVEIAPSTPDEKRLVKEFTDRAKDIYESSGVELVVIPEIAPPGAPSVRLHIKHSEGIEKASMSTGDISKAGAVAHTVVSLRRAPDEPPIFERSFELRLPASERIPNASMLFASREAKLYWDQFFVPVASWQSSAAVRPAVDLKKKVTAVDAVLGRAVVLFSDGDFQLMGLADPEKPVVLARYDRESKLEHFEGVKIVGDKVVLFGQDGLELVSFTSQGPKATATHGRGEVGSVSALVAAKEGLLLASSKGLLLAEADGSNPERVMRRIVLGLDSLGQTLVFTDGESIFVSTLPMLRQNRVVAQLRLGREFKPERVRVVERSAVVMGQGGIVVIDLQDPASPRVVSKMVRNKSGQVADAVRIGNQVFLLGARGVQLLDGKATRIVEVVDVAARERAARVGRHLVVVGDRQLQVVDALPFDPGVSRPASR